ncbi:MAG TPA: hypothetical protein PKU97_12110 [Kofleriaceae bacterium]|nr:hypothetical protein [Kofleriaceae bacterium]
MAKAKGAATQRRARAVRGTAASSSDAPAPRSRQLVAIEVDYSSEDNYLFSYLSDSSTTGIFVRTLTPEPLGTALSVRLVSPLPAPARGGERRALVPCELEVEGEVLWVNAYRPSARDNLHPGMGIRLVALDKVTRARLLALVGRFAVLS